MQWLTKTTITKTYLMAILVVGMTFSPTQGFVLAIALLILNLYATYKQLPLKINIALLFGTIILTPLTLTQLTGSILSSLFVIPAIYLLDQNLKQYTPTQPLQPQKRTRESTPLLKSTIIALGAILATSITLVNVTLISATAVLIAYFTVLLGIAIIKIPAKTIQNTKNWSRLLVGNTEKKTIQLSSLTKQSLYITVTPLQTWVRVKQSMYVLKSDKKADVEVTFTPPLAGPTKIQLGASTLDTRGLILNTQLIEPIELHVLPRAKYAEWLAKKFLEHTGSGASALAATAPLKALKAARNSIEYYGNRPYQPGDSLREVDWKHTHMLGELTVKEFAGAHGQLIISTADMTAQDTQDADRLVYKLVMTALTAATELLPSGIACYNEKEIIVATVPTNPRETLKKVLKLTENVIIITQPTRVTQSIKPSRLATIHKLDEKDRVREMLKLQYEALQNATKQHPATQALSRCTEKTSPPAMIIVMSTKSRDAEALAVALEKLKSKGYKILTV
jgi:uncharacterized protein (DUF58 family)